MQPKPKAGHRDTAHSYINVPRVPLEGLSRACPGYVPLATTHFRHFLASGTLAGHQRDILDRDIGGTFYLCE
jgi:hypothetical protein